MSADYDQLFHSPDSARAVNEDAERDAATTRRGVAMAPVGDATPPPMPFATPPTQAAPVPPPRQTEVTSQIPPIEAAASQPVCDAGLMRAPLSPVRSGAAREEHPAPGSAPGPGTQQFVTSEGAWTSDGQSATSTPMMGNHRAIDALAHVGVRSAVKMPPQRGWRRWIYLLARINLGLSADELYEIELHQRIRRNARDSYQIGVFGLKGGVGKTALTVALGSALSKIRGDRILAVDADPDGGNLADRVGRQSAATIADLLTDTELHRYNDIRAYTSMNNSNLEVLSSAEYSTARREFNDQDWNGATDIASRYYNLVLADSGAGLFQHAARGVLSTVSGLVIVASASIDGARQAAVTVDWLRQNGYQDLLGRSCVVINHVVPGKPNVDIEDLVRQFERHVPPGRVIVLPWDKHIAAGTEIQLGLLGKVFERRIVELAAALSDDFDRIERR
ncbi:MAG: MinD/ParA family protein [Actinomycetia bacterium]|nr:MinD/ParA family protein [Actinomycetes bacterium]MCH9702249.1 MinD/ParA family protein [Actinomycetes bacterium]MCH9760872.1 MinD/ParA family protein [Actinomycetes bacterium]